jgi:hypothetical protein
MDAKFKRVYLIFVYWRECYHLKFIEIAKLF